MAKRRVERELREEREKALRLERELGAWKSLRVQKEGPGRRSGQWPRVGGSDNTGLTVSQSNRSGWGAPVDYDGSEYGGYDAEGGIVIPKRKGSISRQTSFSKGFL